MNEFTITFRTELNMDNFRRRLDNPMIIDWLKIWGINFNDYKTIEELEKERRKV